MAKNPKRTVLLSAWFSEEEAERVRAAAEGNGLPVSGVVRPGALREARRLLGGRKCRHCGERG